MPATLRRFDPVDWQDGVGPAPEWWTGGGRDPLQWVYFKAKLLHLRARAAWLREHGQLSLWGAASPPDVPRSSA